MADDYSINAKITADTSGFEKGVKNAQTASKNLSNSITSVINKLGKSGLVGSMANVSLAVGGLKSSFGTVIKFAKDVGKAVNECTEAYKQQVITERALETAVQNNPFVSGSTTKALKDFASEMQKVSNYGDEELIPMMSNLISLGRTESETMQIMSVALDMSASMGISLDSAITQLNATLNGNIGRLGQQNAELKNLTEEELKQGKAVEILGEKFKGLASATADTSKQLKNIKGDFKEALGQFTLPSSDMWNKFWSGFYEKGIAVLNQFNDYLDKTIIGKQLASNMETYYRSLKGNEKGENIQSYLWTVTDDELKALNAYLSDLKSLSASQQVIYDRTKKEIERREYLAELRKDEAEYQAKEAKKAEERTEKEKELAEQEKKNAEERAKALKLQYEWEDKLFAIRLENLEATRDKELENEKLTQEEREAIVNFYGEQILAMKIKQLEKEREETLAQGNLTEEAKRAINLYYEKRITNAKKDEEEKRLKLKKKEIKEEVKEEKIKLEVIIKLTQEATKKIGDTFKKVSKTIVSSFKTVISGIGNIFKKLADFNINDALDNLLKFEDAILTFFVETLPQLPKFFASAVQSIIKMIQSILTAIDFDVIADIVSSIIKSIGELITTVASFINQNASKLISGLTKIVKSIVDGIGNWLASGGLKELLNAVLVIQKAIETAVVENLPALVDMIVDALPDLIQFLIDSIVSASRALAKLIKPILKLIIELIKALIEVAFSDEVLDASIEVVQALIEALVDIFLNEFPKILPKLITKIIGFVTKSLPKMTNAIVKTIIKLLLNTNWGEVFKGIVEGFGESFSEIGDMLADITSDLANTLGETLALFGTKINEFFQWAIDGIRYVLEGAGKNLWSFFESIRDGIFNFFVGVQNTFFSIGDGIKNAFEGIGDGIKNAFSGVGNGIKSAFEGIGKWFNDLWDGITKGASSACDKLKDGFKWAIDGIKSFFDGLRKTVEKIFSQIGNGIKSAINGVIYTVNLVINGINSVVGWTGIKLNNIGYLAKGTEAAQKGLYLVGEAGPELVNFRGGEQVINNKNTQKLLADNGNKGVNTFNVTFNNTQDTTAFAMMQQLRQYNKQLAINGIF